MAQLGLCQGHLCDPLIISGARPDRMLNAGMGEPARPCPRGMGGLGGNSTPNPPMEPRYLGKRVPIPQSSRTKRRIPSPAMDIPPSGGWSWTYGGREHLEGPGSPLCPPEALRAPVCAARTPNVVSSPRGRESRPGGRTWVLWIIRRSGCGGRSVSDRWRKALPDPSCALGGDSSTRA